MVVCVVCAIVGAGVEIGFTARSVESCCSDRGCSNKFQVSWPFARRRRSAGRHDLPSPACERCIPGNSHEPREGGRVRDCRTPRRLSSTETGRLEKPCGRSFALRKAGHSAVPLPMWKQSASPTRSWAPARKLTRKSKFRVPLRDFEVIAMRNAGLRKTRVIPEIGSPNVTESE